MEVGKGLSCNSVPSCRGLDSRARLPSRYPYFVSGMYLHPGRDVESLGPSWGLNGEAETRLKIHRSPHASTNVEAFLYLH